MKTQASGELKCRNIQDELLFFLQVLIKLQAFEEFSVKIREFVRLSFDMVSLQEKTAALNVTADKEVKFFVSA